MIAFRIESLNRRIVNTAFRCGECGISFGQYIPNGCNYCGGMGLDPKDRVEGSHCITMSPMHASIVLYDLLNYDDTEKKPGCGILECRDVLVRLATAEYRIASIVNTTFEVSNEGCFIPGVNKCYRDDVWRTGTPVGVDIDEDTLSFYRNELIRLAEEGLETEEDIIYGEK